nr:DUF4181 domain-containing protein [Aquibacillus halophilus]
MISAIVLVTVLIIKFFLRKILKIEKVEKEFFSFNYINELHRKVDNRIRNISAITLFILLFVLLYYYEGVIYLFSLALIFFLALETVVRAFFEWNYSSYPKQAILTIAEMFLILIAITIVVQFELLGSY